MRNLQGALSLRYENINLSYCSASHRSRGGGSARSRVWRRGPRSDQSGFFDWLSMPALSALGTTWRACDSISLHFDSRSHPYSEIGPIFVHAEPCKRYSATCEYPADFRNGRVLRAYDAN